MFDKVAVIGAAGKMGSGIALLLLKEIAQTGGQLILIDSHEQGLSGLQKYLRAQLLRYAEKNINSLREWAKDDESLVSNEDIINTYVTQGLDKIRLETDLSQAKKASLIFEAIVEDIEVKSRVFSELKDVDAIFFTNTSSIPIKVIAEKSGLGNKLIGYHFYNPPAVQKLLEIIPTDDADPKNVKLAEAIAKRMGKVIVFSKDVAGFIGNGHFMREINEVLKVVHPIPLSIWDYNEMTEKFLLRPMGIFQLMDYVGLDVCQKVMGIMGHYLNIEFHTALIDQMVSQGVLGGQNPDGSQKNGFFEYERGKIKRIYSLEKKEYVNLPEETLGELPKGCAPWKVMQKAKPEELKAYFETLFAMDTPGAVLAMKHLVMSRDIARNLVNDGVAKTIHDVNTTIMNGFYHLYGPDSEVLPQEVNV